MDSQFWFMGAVIGDTLGAIARRIGCSVERLAEVNGSDVKTLSRLRIGQKLVLPD